MVHYPRYSHEHLSNKRYDVLEKFYQCKCDWTRALPTCPLKSSTHAEGKCSLFVLLTIKSHQNIKCYVNKVIFGSSTWSVEWIRCWKCSVDFPEFCSIPKCRFPFFRISWYVNKPPTGIQKAVFNIIPKKGAFGTELTLLGPRAAEPAKTIRKTPTNLPRRHIKYSNVFFSICRCRLTFACLPMNRIGGSSTKSKHR